MADLFQPANLQRRAQRRTNIIEIIVAHIDEKLCEYINKNQIKFDRKSKQYRRADSLEWR